MKNLFLFRYKTASDGTLSTLYYLGAKVCCFLELPWKNNSPRMSCIPQGRYRVKYLPCSASGKYRDVYHVLDVDNRSGVLIHKGNWAGDAQQNYKTHSLGCLLPASLFFYHKKYKQIMGSNSTKAIRQLHQITGRQDFMLNIIDGF